MRRREARTRTPIAADFELVEAASINETPVAQLKPATIVFADRPVRSAGHAMLSHLLEEWSSSAPDSFAKDPPNATVSAMIKAKNTVADAVVVLRSPKLEGDTLTFDVHVLEGSLAGADGPATVFLDVIDLPVAHRTSRRTAWYSGAN